MRAGILGRADPCVGCQRRDRNVRNGREKEYDGVMEKSLCKRQNNERRKQCCVEANGSKDRPVSLKKKQINLLNQCEALTFTKTVLLTSETKAEWLMRNRVRKWKLPPSVDGFYIQISGSGICYTKNNLVNLSSGKEPVQVGR